MSVNTEIKTFDGKALEQRVSDTIRNTFGMLIPDELWEAKVAAEIQAFFECELSYVWTEQPKTSEYYNRDKVQKLEIRITPFRQMVWEELRKELSQKIKEYYERPDFTSIVGWNGVESHLSAYLDQKLAEIAPKMAERMFRDMFASVVVQAKQEVISQLTDHNY